MKFIGAHLSIAKGVYKIQEQMDLLGANTCGLFLKSQRMFASSPIPEKSIEKFREMVKTPHMLLPHGSYLVNLANPETLEKSYPCFLDDIRRCHSLGIKFYNMHPGSDVKKLGAKCYKMIADGINKAHKEVPDVVVVLENMAGQGSVVGNKFEQLRDIITHVEDKSRVGVCLDTCHLFGAGYDIRTSEQFSSVMEEFDRIVGLKYLKAMHLNDSKEKLGSRKDRHESLGKGHIGLEAFKYVVNSSIFENMPLILETPNPDLYGEEIKLLRGFINLESSK